VVVPAASAAGTDHALAVGGRNVVEIVAAAGTAVAAVAKGPSNHERHLHSENSSPSNEEFIIILL
jgi:hypothetical protein